MNMIVNIANVLNSKILQTYSMTRGLILDL